jgi:hypothetical protein
MYRHQQLRWPQVERSPLLEKDRFELVGGKIDEISILLWERQQVGRITRKLKESESDEGTA